MGTVCSMGSVCATQPGNQKQHQPYTVPDILHYSTLHTHPFPRKKNKHTLIYPSACTRVCPARHASEMPCIYLFVNLAEYSFSKLVYKILVVLTQCFNGEVE